MTTECRQKISTLSLLFIAIVAVAVLLGACTTPEKAKAQHIARGEALLKDKKFQEAAFEFRSALQIDEKLADAHWGLSKSYEGLQRYQEAFEEMRTVVELDANNLDVRVKLGNYYLMGGKESSAAVSEAERLANRYLTTARRQLPKPLEAGQTWLAGHAHVPFPCCKEGRSSVPAHCIQGI